MHKLRNSPWHIVSTTTTKIQTLNCKNKTFIFSFFLSGMIVIKIVKHLHPNSNSFESNVVVYRILKLPKQIYELLLQYAKEKQIRILFSETASLPSENEIIILEPQLLLIHKFSLCPAVQFLQQFYYSQLHSKYNFPII